MGYAVIADHADVESDVGGTEYPLKDPTAKVVREYNELTVRSASASPNERYQIASEMMWKDEWVESEEEVEQEGGQTGTQFTMAEPDLSGYDYRIKLAKLLTLCPDAKVDRYEDYVDFEAVEQARDDFLSRIGRQQNPFASLLS